MSDLSSNLRQTFEATKDAMNLEGVPVVRMDAGADLWPLLAWTDP